MHPRFPSGGLYTITDGPRPDLLTAAAAALSGGAAIVQYRDKTADRTRRIGEARELCELCARHQVPLIINDDIELASYINASGVHLGEHDSDVAAARAQLGAQAIIGVSCYDSLERARQLAAGGADYLAFGAFYPSPTKPQARRASPELLRQAKFLGLPLVAIGGITADNAQPLLDAGADFLAIVSGVFGASDPAIAAKKYSDLFKRKF